MCFSTYLPCFSTSCCFPRYIQFAYTSVLFSSDTGRHDTLSKFSKIKGNLSESDLSTLALKLK